MVYSISKDVSGCETFLSFHCTSVSTFIQSLVLSGDVLR